MTDEDDNRQNQAAQRLSDVLERALDRAKTEYGLSAGAVATALLNASVREALRSMPSTMAVANWLRDVADELEPKVTTNDRPDTIN